MLTRTVSVLGQGLGLYAARDIESHTMVIEYIGTLIRNEVANRMEKMYESQVSLNSHFYHKTRYTTCVRPFCCVLDFIHL